MEDKEPMQKNDMSEMFADKKGIFYMIALFILFISLIIYIFFRRFS